MLDFIKYILSYFKQPQNNITTHRLQDEERPPNFFDLPPGFTPIETLWQEQEIPGTSRRVAIISRILKTPVDECVTYDAKKGVPCGCGHSIFVINEITTPESTEIGLGGQCPYCSLEAAELLNQNLISLQQAEELSLFCSQCVSHCDGCRRNNICVRHTQQFEDLNGTVILLCPDCLQKAEQEKFFKKTLAVMLAPFVDYKRLPPPIQRNNHYDY